MKLIHCADLHLDSDMTSNLTKEKAKERRTELLVTFQRMITYAKENDVHHILISGDLYDKKNISSTARNVFLTAVTDNQDIIFYYLKGNHDAESMFIGMNKIPDNLKLFGTEWTEYKITSEKDNVSNARENARDISDVIKMDVPNCEAYKYTFTYYDSSLETDLHSNVVWIKTDKHIYILDFEVILENKDKYEPIFDQITTSFKENN